MANKKSKLGKPSQSTRGMNYKIRFNYNTDKFVVTNRKRRIMNAKSFKNHGEALIFAKELQENSK